MYTEPLETCPVCAGGAWLPFLSPKDQTVSGEVFHLTTCRTCGFCATNPRPSGAHIGRYYDSPGYISHSNSKAGFQDRLYQFVRRQAIRSKHRLIAHYKPNGQVLDLGCGTGEFLGYLKSQGYLTTGVEPGVAARERAIANYSLEVLPTLEQVPSLEQFKVITLWHVLEHVHDVRDTLKKLHARLSPKGLLVIAVPDRESWDAQHYEAGWAAYDVPRHLSHFRRDDIHRLLTEHGFRMLATKPMWFDAPYVSMLSEKYKGAGALGALMKGTLVGLASNAVAATTPRPTSSSLYVAEKG
jgi:2-polyprenyl-3-methyl-5-hydroxy-6-metoxy-1,4-benzoquinol methylase